MTVMIRDTETLISGLVEELEPVRPLRFARGMALAIAAMSFALLFILTLGNVRSDVASGHPGEIFLLASGLFLLLGLACMASVVLMGSPRVGSLRNGWGWAVAMAGLLPLSAIILVMIEGRSGWQASDPSHGITCLAISLALGLLTAGALVLWLRRGAPTSPERAGLLTGIAAGCAGVFAFSFACPIDSVIHIGLWHGLAVSVSAIAGRLIVPHLVRW